MSVDEPNPDESTQRMPHGMPAIQANGSVTVHLSGPDGAAAPLSDWSDKTVISTRPPVLDSSPPVFPTSQSLGQLLSGKSLDHYDLVEFVGGGGMGAVFRAIDTRLGRTVAVKVLSRDHTDEETIKRFRNEAQSAARLDHPNIARVYFVGEASGWNYIVFEFIEGTNIRELVAADGVLRIEDALRFTLKVAEALDHASKRDVVHRDIKPSNILVTREGDVKLVDMGLARLHQVESSSDDLTASGVTLGTFDYISPEQARDPRTADVRSDIYSLGCTLYYMLCGRPPFPDGTALQKLLWHSGEEPPEMTLFRADLPPRLVAMVQKMLAKRPHQRYQTAADLAAEIVHLGDELGLPPLGAVPAPSASIVSPQATHWAMAASSLLPFVLLLVVIAVLEVILPQSTTSLERPFMPRLANAAVSRPKVSPGSGPPRLTPDDSNEPKPQPGDTIPSEKPKADERPEATPERTTEPSRKPSDDTATATNTAPPGPGTTEIVSAAVGTPAVTPRPRTWAKVIVRPGESKPESGVVGQLSAAVKLAAEKGVTEIELQFNGLSVERSVDLVGPVVNVHAADGFHPVLVFRPQVGGLADEQRMIRLSGAGVGKFGWKGIEFRLELPAEASSQGWALFALSQVHTLSIEDCFVTIKNAGPSGPIHFPVSVCEFVPPRSTDNMMDAGGVMTAPTTLLVERSLIRGEAGFIRMNEEVPCEFLCRQSLLALSEHLFATTGAVAKPKWHGQIEWRWENATLYTGQGLYQLQRRNDASYQFDLDIRCDHCRFLTGRNVPLFDLQNGPRVTDLRMQFDGVGNAYPSDRQTFLRIKAKGEDLLEYDLQHRQDWSNERKSRYDAELPATPMNVPWHALSVDSFASPPGTPLTDGVDLSQLPAAFVAPPPVAPPPETSAKEDAS